MTEISEFAFEDCPDLTIKCYKDSYAEEYAIDNDIYYEIMRWYTMNLLKILNESFESKYLIESNQDKLNFEEKFGKELTDQFLNIRKKLKSPENNIYYWIKNKSIEELSDFLSSYQSKSEIKRINKQKGSTLLLDKDGV